MIGGWILEFIIAAWNFAIALVQQLWGIVTLPAQAMLAALKSAFSTEIGPPPFWEYLEFANLYIDITSILTIILLYVNFLGVWITYRVVKSWIPTVSGS